MKLTKRTLAFLCTLIMVLQLFSGLSLVSAEEAQVWKLADGVEIGKTYVIVADGKYAMTNEEVEGLRSYSGASTTRGAKEVTIEGGMITSEVTDAMKWTPVAPEGAQEKGYDGEPQFFLTDSTGKYLRRGSMSQQTSTLALEDSIVINGSTIKNIRYYTFSTHAYADLEKTYSLYVNSEQAYGNDYPGYVFGGEYNGKTGFDIPGRLEQRDANDPFAFMSKENCSHIQFYTLTSDEGGDEETPIEHPELPIWENQYDYTFAERAADLIARMSVAQKGSQLVSTASAIPAASLGGGALNVPATKGIDSYEWWSEALHGYSRGSTNGAVIYPQNLTIASTWNPELYYRQATQISDEIREKAPKNGQTGNAKSLNFYSPTVNMHRDPRWGRNEESFSEDVYLTGKMASEFVLGMEGKDRDGNLLDPNGYLKTMTTVKHYVANNSEVNRLSGGAESDLRALREYYAAPYAAVIRKAAVHSVMTAYSTFNGEPSSYSSYLMDTLLRQTYGFKGHITSDCDSVATQNRLAYTNPYTGQTMTDLEALAGSLAHGEDLECNGGYSGFGTYATKLARMIDAAPQTDKGIFTENAADVGLLHMFTDRIATGEFDENLAYTAAAAARPGGQTQERLDIIDEVNREGVVLLKNNGLLPLAIPAEGEYKVAIVGGWATQTYTGLYSAGVSGNSNVNILKGIEDAIKAKNPNATFTEITTSGHNSRNAYTSGSLTDEQKAAITAADVVVVVTGTDSNYSKEDGDRATIALPYGQADMISDCAKLNAKTIAIMETCGAMQVKTFEGDVAALLWSSFGGLRKGVGFADVIVGNVNPSGRLTDTWYQDVTNAQGAESDIPSVLDYNMYATNGSNGRTYMYYQGEKAPSYPFGYGLSYTTFEYSNLKIDKTSYDANDTVKVTFDVKNTGSVAGKEVTQLYIAQPEAAKELNRPIRRLEGFEKIELQPGETKTVSMEVKVPDLAFFDETDKRFEVDTGKYQVQVGKDSAHADLKADFTVTGTMDVYPVLLTVKANQEGDTAKGIEERVIFDKGSIVNPQLTVAMNDESLRGYVIANQQSPIDKVKSSPLPEGMTFTYSSNRPSVAKVENGTIKAVGAGVATITVTGKLDDIVLTTDFVVYVEASAKLDGITLDGKAMEDFDSEKFAYELDANDFEKAPVVGYVSSNPDLEITVEQFPGIPGVAVITAVDPGSGTTCVYRLGLGYPPVSTDFKEGWEAAQAKRWTVENGNENATFGENGLTIVGEAGMAANLYSEPAFGEWAAQTNVTLAAAPGANGQQVGLIVRDNADNYVLLVYERVTTTSWGRERTNYYVTAYSCVGGERAQVARTGNLGAQTNVSLRVIKSGEGYTFAYSLDGKDWPELSGEAKVTLAAPKLGPFCGGAAGLTATFDGINVCTVKELYPRLASVTLNGAPLGEFDPETFVYNFEVKPEDKAPVLAATPEEGFEIEVKNIDTTTGIATIVVYNDIASAEYTFCFNYAPVSDYFADANIGEQWTIEREDAEAYSIEKGKGIVMPTQQGDIHSTGGAWKNAFVAPAMGNWQMVAKIVYPHVPTANYQQAMFLVWQDENNYLRMNCQTSNLNMEPGIEINGSFNGNLGSGQALPAEDGTVTLYFMIDKAGNDYTVGYSQDGRTFTKLRTASADFKDPKIGLFATQNSSSDPMDMYFEYVCATWFNGVEQLTYPQMLDWAAGEAASYIAADIPDTVEEDITLSEAPHGYTVALASSKPDVISAEGKYTKPEYDTKVTLTVTVTEGDAIGTAEKVVTVPGEKGPRPLDKAALEAAIKDAEAIETDAYTEESVKALNEALAAAKKALDEAETQEEIDAAKKALDDAVAALEKKPDVPIPGGDDWVITDKIELGKPYVIVADGKYALTNRQEGPALRTYAGNATTSLASAAVTVEGDKITSEVKDDMQWVFAESTAEPAYDKQTQYFLQDLAGNYLRRGSGSSGQGAQLLVEPNLYSTIRYNAWSFYPYADENAFAMYANSERAYGTDYPFYVYGGETTFDSPGHAQRDENDPFAFINESECSHITLYTKGSASGMEDIDFTTEADSYKYEIVGQSDSEVREGEGLYMISTMKAIEYAGTHYQDGYEMLQGEDANTPVDIVVTPVNGDWTATLNFKFDQNGSPGYYEFFGFYAMEGTDWQNLVGIRGADGDMQDMLRKDGAITAAAHSYDGSNLKASDIHWLRIKKTGDTYICSGSTDGENFVEFFTLEGTGINADHIMIDAYSSMSQGYTYMLQSLKYGETTPEEPVLDKTALETAIEEAEAVKKDEYTEETVKALDEALEAAKKALDEAKTQDELDAAAKALNDAIAALEKKPEEPVLDKTELEKAIKDAEAVKKDDYTEETVKALEDALAAAKKALTDAKTQAELDDAAKALNDAIKALEKKPEEPVLDKAPLEKAIEEAEKLDADKYTDETAKALAEAIAAAKKALEEAKTQAELDAAKKALDDAIAALVEKTEPTPTPIPTPTPGPHVCPGKNFTDMPAVDYWSHAPIDWAIVNKITVGTSETTFGPTEGCTRAQVVTFLWRAAKEPAPTSKENPFKDVKESDYFYNAVLWAVEKGITVGTDPDKFSPGETCTRAQIVTFLYRYEGKPEVKPDDSFTDVKPGDYFADSVAWAVANGITVGTDPGKFSPYDTCTREQVVTFLYRDIAE